MWTDADDCGKQLADWAVQALLEEAELTPKPGLVDLRSSGSHDNMDISLMKASAASLRTCFEAMGKAAYRRNPEQELREELAFLGRLGEQEMMRVTHGVNTHRGAIWALGLLLAGCAVHCAPATAWEIAAIAGTIAKFPDRYAPQQPTNGMEVAQKYGVQGARGEALKCFPHVTRIGLPVLEGMRARKAPEQTARLHALLSIMASLQDSCLLHRGGPQALEAVQRGARNVLESGGMGTASGRKAYRLLEQSMLEHRLSPGGSADLIAAVLFLDKIQSTSGIANKPQGGFGHRTVTLSV
ncbi:triphosphoribosyl-dephospho-CoA synthase [Paenibacillus allorhizosphaerae]|uniref:triphosphoribosyl-dephospho-CoA synthase n=1 Tax=Paenibacillus allorhizosphaerae TaxID=2849866 RepID=A0ABN7TUS9_9BACL|nr:triphosphoribosyl-dephospho-CoA synthase [Paenibacillus allorhizosphaerae]CAG7652659.1 2-(5''-triphosphoribosyl)-3'-dephosphocoenzyme-A synthase [Paenibacillus allorhizosphaerae]